MASRERQFDINDDFLSKLGDHELTIELDDGVHRSLSFNRMENGKPSMIYSFRLNTWPGHLAMSGDMGTFVFSRLRDMFEFFRQEDDGEIKVNHGYWHEKLQAEDSCGTNGAMEFKPDMVRDFIDYAVEGEYLTKEEADELKEEFGWDECDERRAYELIRNKHPNLMDDPPRFRGYTWRFTWCLHAIVWGIRQYDKQKKDGEGSKTGGAADSAPENHEEVQD